MAVTIEDIKKLRAMTGAGMKDCKKAFRPHHIQRLRTREERQWLRCHDRPEVRDRLRG